MTQADEIRTIREDIQAIRESQVRLEELQPHCNTRFTSLENDMYGNGKAGLKSDVTRLKVWFVLGGGACIAAGGFLGYLLEKLLS